MRKDLHPFVLLNLLICISLAELNAQYHPMPTSPARWDVTRCWYFYPGGWYDRFYIEMDGSDTVLNQKVYKKLYHTTHHAPGTEFDSIYTHFLGGIREEGKQVFMWSEYLCLDTLERMIYDFNDAVTGDTIYTQVLTNGLTQFIPHIVTSVDEVDIDGQAHRRINLRDENFYFTESWIEGVGSSMGLVYATYWLLTDNSYDLNCFYINYQLEYQNPNPAYAFCTSPFPPGECDSVITSPRPEPNPFYVKIFPNPVHSTLFIQGTHDIQMVEIYNMVGIRIAVIPFQTGMDVDDLMAGMYILRFRSVVADQSFVTRIIKI